MPRKEHHRPLWFEYDRRHPLEEGCVFRGHGWMAGSATYHDGCGQAGRVKNNGTLTGFTGAGNTPADRWGRENVRATLGFNSTSNHVTAGNRADFTFGNGTTDSPFTVGARIFRTADTSAICSKYYGGGVYKYEWRVIVASNALTFNGYDFSAAAYRGRSSSSIAASKGKWQTIICRYVGGTSAAAWEIWADGLKIDNADFASGAYVAMEPTISPFTIGVEQQGVVPIYASGQIADLTIWRNAISTGEMETYFSPDPMYGGWLYDPARTVVGFSGLAAFNRRRRLLFACGA
jgi:hypothetical protein